jgi:hypothetical protein
VGLVHVPGSPAAATTILARLFLSLPLVWLNRLSVPFLSFFK